MEMKIKFYDVEHGNCTHIITPNNQHFLVDIGSKTSSSLARHIKYRYLKDPKKRIDYLIITHPHEDHIYDLPVLKELGILPRVLNRPKSAFDIKPTINTELHKKIADVANSMNKNYNAKVDFNESPINPEYNGGIKFRFIYPKSEWTDKSDINSYSSIIVVEFFSFKFVLTGDNPKSILQKMIDENHEDIKSKVKDATVLLAPHHGRIGEFCKDFFNCVNPILTVISDKNIEYATQDNSASLYKGKGAKLNGRDRYVLTTRNEGTITFTIAQENCYVSWDKEEY